jgi:hypothetical protein
VNLSFSPATVGNTSTPAQQLTASFSVTGSDALTASLHYGTDFTSGAVSCTSSGNSQTCTVPVTFTPILPGARRDALFLKDGATILATVYLGGVGQGPQALIQPGVITQLVSGSPYSLRPRAVGEDGTLYIDVQSTANASNVYSVTQSGAMNPVPVTVNTSSAIAVDGAGILYINPNNFNSEFTTWNTVTQTQGSLLITPPLPNPCPNPDYLNAITVDSLANLFILQNNCQEVIERRPNGTYMINAFEPQIVGTANWIAVDSAENVFFSSENQVNEMLASGSQSSLDIAGVGGGSTALAVDPADSLYAIPAEVGNVISELPAPDYQSVLAELDPLVSVNTFALGSDGTLYVGYLNSANFTFNIDKVDRSQGEIAFGQQVVGTASATQSAGIYNGGNESLTITSIALTGASSGFALQQAASNNCSNGQVLAPGTSCQVAANLNPAHVGNLSGSVVFSTNSLNNSNATESVALSGFVAGSYATLSPTPLAFPNQNVSTTSAVNAVTLTNTGTVELTNIAVSLTGTNTSDFAIATGTSACGSSLAIGSSCFIYVTFTPQAATSYAATLSVSDNATNSPQTAVLTGTGGMPPASLAIDEAIHVTDVRASTPLSAMLNIAEVIYTSDVRASTPLSAMLNIAEVIHTSDASTLALVMSATLNIAEVIHTTDAEMLTSAASPTQTSLSSSINPSVAGQSVTFTAAVSSTAGAPSGTVQFNINGTAAGSPVPLNAAGQALYSTGALADGTNSISAVYSGSTGFTGSTSTALAQTVLDFAFTVGSTPSMTVSPGQSASYQFTLAPQGVFGDNIIFSASGLPPGATASFNPQSVTPSATSSTVTMTVQTAQLNAAVRSPWLSRTNSPLLLGILLPLFGIGRVRRRFKRTVILMAAILSLGATLALGGCGSDQSSNPPQQTYTITVTATSGSLQRSTTVNLTVQ